jgi:hypothetical protein
MGEVGSGQAQNKWVGSNEPSAKTGVLQLWRLIGKEPISQSSSLSFALVQMQECLLVTK